MKYTTALLLLITIMANGQATNSFPTDGNAGIGTISPGAGLHIKSNTGVVPWLALDKNSSSEEAGIQFRKGGSVLYYMYSDNGDDALKIQSTGASGENDGLPRIHIPYSSKDIYLAQSGGKVGLGTSSPSYRLHIKSSDLVDRVVIQGSSSAANLGFMIMNQDGSERWSLAAPYSANTLQFFKGGYGNVMVLTDNGNVGIGTSNPNAKLHINGGDLLLQNQTSGYPILWLKDVSGAQTIRMDYNSIIGSGDNLYLRSGASNNLILNDVGGGVGIGTTSIGTFKLAVFGKVWAQEVQVALTNPGPDYVFEPNYKLLSLEEIKKYIDQHKHLPEVPSAKEMETNGVNVSEMNMLLLRKIEELTLHLIEQNKIIAQLQEERRTSPDHSGKKIEELTLYQIESSKQIETLKARVTELEVKQKN